MLRLLSGERERGLLSLLSPCHAANCDYQRNVNCFTTDMNSNFCPSKNRKQLKLVSSLSLLLSISLSLCLSALLSCSCWQLWRFYSPAMLSMSFYLSIPIPIPIPSLARSQWKLLLSQRIIQPTDVISADSATSLPSYTILQTHSHR